jgi:hypothetical protein
VIFGLMRLKISLAVYILCRHNLKYLMTAEQRQLQQFHEIPAKLP